jgi:hypothetical protein
MNDGEKSKWNQRSLVDRMEENANSPLLATTSKLPWSGQEENDVMMNAKAKKQSSFSPPNKEHIHQVIIRCRLVCVYLVCV